MSRRTTLFLPESPVEITQGLACGEAHPGTHNLVLDMAMLSLSVDPSAAMRRREGLSPDSGLCGSHSCQRCHPNSPLSGHAGFQLLFSLVIDRLGTPLSSVLDSHVFFKQLVLCLHQMERQGKFRPRRRSGFPVVCHERESILHQRGGASPWFLFCRASTDRLISDFLTSMPSGFT